MLLLLVGFLPVAYVVSHFVFRVLQNLRFGCLHPLIAFAWVGMFPFLSLSLSLSLSPLAWISRRRMMRGGIHLCPPVAYAFVSHFDFRVLQNLRFGCLHPLIVFAWVGILLLLLLSLSVFPLAWV